MTAGDVVDRIRKNLGVPWRETTHRDTFKAGSLDTAVTGIATTVFASFDMIQRAVAAGLNMIVPHEVTFWNDRDDVGVVSADFLVDGSVVATLFAAPWEFTWDTTSASTGKSTRNSGKLSLPRADVCAPRCATPK